MKLFRVTDSEWMRTLQRTHAHTQRHIHVVSICFVQCWTAVVVIVTASFDAETKWNECWTDYKRENQKNANLQQIICLWTHHSAILVFSFACNARSCFGVHFSPIINRRSLDSSLILGIIIIVITICCCCCCVSHRYIFRFKFCLCMRAFDRHKMDFAIFKRPNQCVDILLHHTKIH